MSAQTIAGYRTLLDPRSMAMGGTGAAAATKFNASLHNPALIAFNRGSKPDRLYLSASMGARELYNTDWEESLNNFQDSNIVQDYDRLANPSSSDAAEVRDVIRQMNLEGYRKDETTVFNLLVDTRPVTINFYTRRDIREMTTILNKDEEQFATLINGLNGGAPAVGTLEERLTSTVDNTYVDISEFGVTVATTNVISYNMPISWGFTPKLVEIRGSHRAESINTYNPRNPPDKQVSRDFLEWNVDLGFSMLMTESFMREELGLSGPILDGEWIFSFVGMNMIPTDFTPYRPENASRTGPYPGTARAVQALYQFGVAHYRQNYMLTMDIDLSENEVYDFEGLTRFLSFGGEYFLRDDFHLRAGMRINMAQTSEAAKDKAILTGGFLYQPHGFSIEAAAMINEVEIGGTVGLGYAF
ncbi:hypothetical protein A3762_02785 [Oleiphilus sp. HI0125]|uniref:conjugal transfer protein TraF n=3 Tax=Oleiphilus sp. HI0125 TaxID=1822266 RepID=UPI0007C24246|nr:conjugal transfer protein TraF [Oleiphilus sp. HI0125]KZZ60822.1 hypothetical protein A3762_02785 [Oleiphilus sp. HI0125]